MIEKRSIDEIIKSIFLLVNEAKQKYEQIENSSKPTDLLTKNSLAPKPLDKNIVEDKKTTSDWRKIKFTQEIKKKSNLDVKETLANQIRNKSELKFRIEMEKWAKNKIPGILNKHLTQHTKSLLK